MKRTMLILLTIEVCRLAGFGQILQPEYGVPCDYYFSGLSGYTGCASGGRCNPQLINGPSRVDTSWYEHWACSNGIVEASGMTNLLYEYYIPAQGPSQSVLMGLYTQGRADVIQYFGGGSSTFSSYRGWDEEDCYGEVNYSGPYSYTC